MDWNAYKARCDHPRVLSRWMLTRTAQWVDAPCAALLHDAAKVAPLPKPPGHKGGPDTDMFEVDLAPEVARAILRSVRDAAETYERGDSAPKENARQAPAPTASLNGYVAAWREYCDAGPS